jgi:predicted ATPase
MGAVFVRRVVLRNYKSIAACDLHLGSLTFLVGPNGSGKSNFVDALRLVADGLVSPFDHALRERGGIDAVRRRSTGHPHNFGIRLELDLPDGRRALFAFEVAAKTNGAFDIKEERCSISSSPLFNPQSGVADASYVVRRGEVVQCSLPSAPPAVADRLYLVNMGGRPEFRSLYDLLSSMAFYNLNPSEIREVQPPDPGRILVRDGRNLAGVLGRLEHDAPEEFARIKEYLSKIVPDIRGVERTQVANKETLQFHQNVRGSKHPWTFYANSMSDGTLRALAILTALGQSADKGQPVPLVAIEEPEAALHPAAAFVLFEALRDASTHTQVLVTSHSPELLDNESIDEKQLLAVTATSGVTTIGPISEVGRSVLRDRLYTAGELLRLSQLQPNEESVALDPEQLDLFNELES